MKWPKYLQKKRALFSPDTPKEELIRWGDRFMDANRLHDAVAFYTQARYVEGLQKIRQIAIEDGDFCLFREALDGMEAPSVEREEWAHMAEKAEAKKRWNDACKAYEQLKDERGIRRAREAMEQLIAGPQDRTESVKQADKGARA